MNSETISRSCRLPLMLLLGFLLAQVAAAQIIEEKGKTYLIDQAGERWDITQAGSIGFEQRYFEFGIGRDAFRTLSESDWSSGDDNHTSNFRVIGIAAGDEAHAYAVSNRLDIQKNLCALRQRNRNALVSF